MSDKFQALRELIVQVSAHSTGFEITPETDLYEFGLIDSFSTIQLIMAFEEKFNITFDYSDFRGDNFCNMTAIANMLEKKYAVKLTP